MPIHELKYLHNTTVEQFDRKKTLFLMTVSPIEAHGPHFPLGADILQSEGFLDVLSKRFAKENPDWNVVLVPPVTVGADVLPMPGALVMPAETLQEYLYHFLKNFAWHGFENVYLMGFHGGIRHNVAIEDALEQIHKEFGVRYLYGLGRVGSSLFVTEKIKEMLMEHGGLTDDQASRDAHGGAMETAIGLHLFPEAMNGLHKGLPDVHMVDYAPLGREGADVLHRLSNFPPTATLGRILGVLNGYFGWRRIAEEELGYVGSPALGTKELGKKLTKLITDQMYQDLMAELERPATDNPRDGSAYNMGKAIGPGTLGSKLFGTYMGPRRMTPEREKHHLSIPEVAPAKSVADKKKQPATKSVRVKSPAKKKA